MTTVVSSAYQSAITYPLTHARIGYENWVNELAAASITVSSQVTGFPKDAPTRPDTYEGWRPSGAGTWVADLGSAKSVNYAGLIGVDLDGVTVTLQYADSGSGPWTTFASAVAMADDSPIMLFDATVSKRYWRISLSDEATILVVYLGRELVMPRPYFDGSTPPSLDRQTEIRSSQSRGGQFLGQDILRYGVAGSLHWQNLDPTWYRANFDPLVLHLRDKPIFYAWNLNFPNETGYIWTSDKVKPTQQAMTPGGLISVGFSYKGIGYRV